MRIAGRMSERARIDSGDRIVFMAIYTICFPFCLLQALRTDREMAGIKPRRSLLAQAHSAAAIRAASSFIGM
jgi:hypothetical protein